MLFRVRREHKSTPKALVHPSIADITWAAGFMEGEGSFISRTIGNEVRATQVNLEPLKKLQILFGGTIRPVKRPLGYRWSQCYIWKVCGARARGLAMTLYTFMSSKRKTQLRKMLCVAVGATRGVEETCLVTCYRVIFRDVKQ